MWPRYARKGPCHRRISHRLRAPVSMVRAELKGGLDKGQYILPRDLRLKHMGRRDDVAASAAERLDAFFHFGAHLLGCAEGHRPLYAHAAPVSRSNLACTWGVKERLYGTRSGRPRRQAVRRRSLIGKSLRPSLSIRVPLSRLGCAKALLCATATAAGTP